MRDEVEIAAVPSFKLSSWERERGPEIYMYIYMYTYVLRAADGR
jgi:hypothetical protein